MKIINKIISFFILINISLCTYSFGLKFVQDNKYNIYGVIATENEVYSNYNSNLVHYDKSMAAYFDNLTYNFGQNYKESCSYVALCMMLSYYDTFLNDDIIPEQYDVISSGTERDMSMRRNSPGIMKDIIVNPENTKDAFSFARKLTNTEYYFKIREMADKSLHSKLMSMAVSDVSGLDSSFYPFGGNVGTMYIMLDNYFSQVVNFKKGEDYNAEYIYYSEDIGNEPEGVKDRKIIRNYVINKIRAGYPVWVGVNPQSGMGHACVAYDYNPYTDEIFCHMGWGAGTTHVTAESYGLINFDSAMIIDFNVPHKHSDNYEVVSVGFPIKSNTYCPCSNEITIFNAHSYQYENTDTSAHTKFCGCGKSDLVAHSYLEKYIEISGADSWRFHKAYCICNAFKKENHSIVKKQVGLNTYTYCIKCNWVLIDNLKN